MVYSNKVWYYGVCGVTPAVIWNGMDIVCLWFDVGGLRKEC